MIGVLAFCLGCLGLALRSGPPSSTLAHTLTLPPRSIHALEFQARR